MRSILLASTLALAAGAGAAQDVTRMGTEGAYPPYSYLNDAGELEGFEIDLGNELCSRAGLTCQWVTNDWDSIIPNLVSGNYDTIMAGMSITPERDAVIDFSQDYVPPTPSSFVGLSADVDVASAVVAAQTSTLQSDYVAQSGATLLEYATQDESIAAVRAGEADAVFGDTDYLVPIVEASGGELTFIGDPVPLGDGIGIGLRESDTELKAKLDEAIAAMKEDGSLNALLSRWFGAEAPSY
jgi:polar amino acid transport system substrate-binding protein